MFIYEKQLNGDSLSEAFTCENALDIYGDLVKKNIVANSNDFGFKASRGWLEKLRKEVEFKVYLGIERRQILTI